MFIKLVILFAKIVIRISRVTRLLKNKAKVTLFSIGLLFGVILFI